MLKIYMQLAGLLTWRCGEKTSRYSVRFLAPLLTLFQYSTKCPCLSHPSTLLPTVLCTTLLEAHVISNSLLFLSAKQSQWGLKEWLSNKKIICLKLENKKLAVQISVYMSTRSVYTCLLVIYCDFNFIILIHILHIFTCEFSNSIFIWFPVAKMFCLTFRGLHGLWAVFSWNLF